MQLKPLKLTCSDTTNQSIAFRKV